eukprot:5472592-Pleurochrysis_carterae.AAC.1
MGIRLSRKVRARQYYVFVRTQGTDQNLPPGGPSTLARGLTAPWLGALGAHSLSPPGPLCACAPDLSGAGALWPPRDGWAGGPDATPETPARDELSPPTSPSTPSPNC